MQPPRAAGCVRAAGPIARLELPSIVGLAWGYRGAEVRRALMMAWGGMSALTAWMCLHSRPRLRLLNLKSGQEQLHFELGRRLMK